MLEQEQPVLVHQFEAKFDIASGGPYTVTIKRVNLTPNLEPIAGEDIAKPDAPRNEPPRI